VKIGRHHRDSRYFGMFDMACCWFRAHELFEDVHELFGKRMIGLILLHVAEAATHQSQGRRHRVG
jgi:cytochrome b561